jgi:hypothetical protein
MRRNSTVIVSLAVFLLTLVASHGAIAQQIVSTPPTVLDSIAAQLVELELVRISSNATIAGQAGVPHDVSDRIAVLYARLRALPNGAVAERDVTGRVLLALDAHASTVQARLQQLRFTYTDAHPIVRETEAEGRAIELRLSELRGPR